MKKTIILLCLTLTLLLSALTGCGLFSKYPDRNANPTSDFEYLVTDDNKISITKYIGTDTSVVIPQKIESKEIASIGESAFLETNIKTLIMPNTITSIHRTAFAGCKELTDVQFSNNLEYIVMGAFADCTALKKVDLSSSTMKAIDQFAFYNCESLTEVRFGSNITIIRDRAFMYCKALKEVVLPSTLTELGVLAFSDCTSLKHITIPSKLDLQYVDYPCLSNVPSLERITFEEGREEITGYALLQTDASVEIIVPESVKRFSPLPFLINPSTHITITFLGDAPEISEESTWFGNPTIFYNSKTSGWDQFEWNGKYKMEIIK